MLHIDSDPEPDTFITFLEETWAFTSDSQLVYCSSEDNLSHVLENGSATSSTCPVCGWGSDTDDGCAAYYFPETNVTYFWNCEADVTHHKALKGYRLDERDHIKQLQNRLNIGTVKGQFSNIDQIRETLKELNYELMEEESKESRFEIWKEITKGGWPGPPPNPGYYVYIDRAHLLVFIGHDSFVPEDYMFFPKETE